MNQLFYGDNLEIMRKFIKDESVDLCYIDPPFNSKRTYNQIYMNTGKETAQVRSFIDTWRWDSAASNGYDEIISNSRGIFTIQTIELISALRKVLGQGSLLAYLISLALRVSEIQRILKPTGSFYLHCDTTCGHYIKILLDSVFISKGGDIRNEIIWAYSRMAANGQKQLSRCHDTIFWYAKGKKWTFNVDKIRLPYSESSKARAGYKKTNLGGGSPKSEICELNEKGKFPEDWIQIPFLRGKEYLGYQTQKPESLLERIILASSNEGDVVFDAYCGCGTTVAVSQKLKRKWIGIDISYQAISLIIKRLENTFDTELLDEINFHGIPIDFDSAVALANKKDDRLRKEFEKWAVLTYTNNRGMIHEKKGGDGGIDGIAKIVDIDANNQQIDSQIIFSVKSNKTLSPNIIRELFGTVERENASMGYLITLYPMDNLIKETKKYGSYHNVLLGKTFDKIQIVSIKDILDGKRLEIPSIGILKKAEYKGLNKQLKIGE